MVTHSSGAARMFAILDLFSRSSEPLTLSYVSDQTSLPKPTAFRYLRDLVAWGGLEKVSDGRYRIGPKMWVLGSASVWERKVRRESHPLLAAVAQGLHHAVALTTLHHGRMVCIDRAWGAVPSIYLVQPGDEVPLPPSSAGKVLLSMLDEAEFTGALAGLHDSFESSAHARFDARPREVHDYDQFLRTVDAARDRGYCLAAGELHPGQLSLSVPVDIPRLETDLALTLLVPIDRQRTAVQYLPHLKDAAAMLAKRLATVSGRFP